MIQQRIPKEAGGDGRWYSPDRDLAYAMPHLARAAMDQLSVERWDPEFRSYFVASGVTEEDIGQAAQALALFIGYCADPSFADPRAALVKAGWFDCKSPAQIAILLKLGQIHLCAFFNAIRDVTFAGDKLSFDPQLLYDSAMRATFQLRSSRFRRWLRRQWLYVKGMFRWHKPTDPNPGPPPVQ